MSLLGMSTIKLIRKVQRKSTQWIIAILCIEKSFLYFLEKILIQVNQKVRTLADFALKKNMKNIVILSIIVGTFPFMTSKAQSVGEEVPEKRCFVGSTLFVLATPTLTPSPEYYQLNLGYWLSPKDVLSLEAITWAYYAPLGIPYGPDLDKKANNFPGKVKAYGMGLAYKRFIWKGIYAQVHATALHQDYIDEQGTKIQSGFQLFNTLRVGYHFRLLKNRLFIEPSIAATAWPINTNLPDSFQAQENKWNSFFLFEPGLHVGFNF